MVLSVSFSLSYAMIWNNLLFLLQHTRRLLTRWFHALNPATSIGVEERTLPSMHSHEDLGPAAPENVHSEALLVAVDGLEVIQSRDDEDGRRAGVRGELGRQASMFPLSDQEQKRRPSIAAKRAYDNSTYAPLNPTKNQDGDESGATRALEIQRQG